MIELTADEARVLGVLIEKSTTTPDQYPLTLNATLAGANQKNNRDPVITMEETAAFEALEGLRRKGLAVRVDAVGSRTNRYRHNTGDALRARPAEVALLAELLLRGPQTLGELRGRASRMHPFETLDDVKNMLRALIERDEPLAREMPPLPGSRAERYATLLCPATEPADEPAAEEESISSTPQRAGLPASNPLADRVSQLEADVAALRGALRRLASSLGESDPLAPTETAQT
jgi:uncharacterized protein YceH (UPF0502 family)